MRIGLTFDLRSEYLALGWSAEDAAEFDTEATIESIESGLRELGHEVVRIGRCHAAGRAACRRANDGTWSSTSAKARAGAAARRRSRRCSSASTSRTPSATRSPPR